MKEFLLKNGASAQIDTWGFNRIKDYVSRNIPTRNLNNMGDKSFVGFAFFGPRLASDLERVDPYNNYPNRTDDHAAVVATVEEEAIGLIVIQWVKFGLPFWHYHIRWIDVRQDYKNRGVGTNLVKYLNEEEFIKGKVLLLSMLTKEGETYIAKTMKDELKAKDYTLVFEDEIPESVNRFGKYGGEYWGRHG